MVSIRAPTTALSPAAVPTDRSMPPISSTNVCPSATSPTKDALRSTMGRLLSVKKFGVATASSAQSARRATSTPLASQRRNRASGDARRWAGRDGAAWAIWSTIRSASRQLIAIRSSDSCVASSARWHPFTRPSCSTRMRSDTSSTSASSDEM